MATEIVPYHPADADGTHDSRYRTRADLANHIPEAPGDDNQVLRVYGGIPRYVYAPNILASRYLSGDPAENASPILAELITDAKGDAGPIGVHGANIEFGPGEYRLTDTLNLERFTGRIGGSGPGISPHYTTAPGKGTVFRWDGPTDKAMFRINNSRDLTFEQFRMEGSETTPPTYGFNFERISGDGAGTNGYLVIADVIIGQYPWTRQGIWKGLVKRGIGFTGDNGDNDQFRIKRVIITNPTEYGVYFPNTQSVGGTWENVTIGAPGIAAAVVGATTRFYDIEIFDAPIGFDIVQPNVVLDLYGLYSEHSDTIINTWTSGVVNMNGGMVQVGETILGSGVLIDAFPSGNLTLNIIGTRFTQNTNPALAKILVGPDQTLGPTGSFRVNVVNAQELHPSQIQLHPDAEFWAQNPMSQGTIEWSSTYDNENFAFRNELRHSSVRYARNTIDINAWDEPMATESTILKRRRFRTLNSRTATYTATVDDDVLPIDASAAPVTVNLNTAVGIAGKVLTVKKMDNVNNVTLDASGAETIDGAATKSITSQFGWLEIMSDGTNWLIMSQGGTIV